MPSHINSASRTRPSTVMRILEVWRNWRSSDTSLNASASASSPSALTACMRSGYSTASCARARRPGRSSSLNVFIRKPTEPQFMP